MGDRRRMWSALVLLGLGVVSIVAVGREPGRLPRLGVPADMVHPASLQAGDAVLHAGPIVYEVDGPLDEPSGPVPAYSLVGTTDGAAVAALARTLGLEGEVRVDGHEWSVVDGRRGLHVARQPGLPWWYSVEDFTDLSVSAPPTDGDLAACTCLEGTVCDCDGPAGPPPDDIPCEMPPCPEGQACIQVCPQPPVPVVPPGAAPAPERPSGLPDRATAEEVARTELARLGVDLGGAAARVDDGFDRWYVTFERRVGGLRAIGLDASAVIGPEQALLSASGHLARPDEVGRYPLAGLDVGLERLRAGRPTGAGWAAHDLAAVADDCPPAAGCGPPVPEVVRTVRSVELGLLLLGHHLVPAYLFGVAHGAWEPVVAVADEHLEPLVPSTLGAIDPAR